MLSIGKLAAGPGAGRYYVDQVARGREDYYAGAGESPGAWMGRGAALLELRGEVTEGRIGWLLDGRDPGSGVLLRRPLASGAIAGFDLTFRAPKSVSILFGISEPAVSAVVRAAHEHAVGEALAYLDRTACRARRGHAGALQVTGDGFVAAAFRHRSSRAGDPLLHTHVVIANGTRGPDGRWTALDGRPLYRHAKTAGYLYQAVLRAELTDRLGVLWSVVENGTADIKGVPRSVIAHLSRRRQEIVEYMRQRGEHSARAAQIATLQTRRRKYGVPADRLREEWRARAAEHGLDARRVRRLLHLVRRRAPDPRHAAEVATGLLGANGLTRDRSTFTRGDVLQALAEAARSGSSITALEARADVLLTSDRIVTLAEDGGEARYTTHELLAVERILLDGAQRQAARTDVAVASPPALDASLATRLTVTSEQHALVVELARGGTGVAVVRAAAGTGKTFALDAAREAWQRSGVPVLGCALSARAACELRDQAGMEATTIARLTYGFDHGLRLAANSVLVVDEAGMVGTRHLARLAQAAAAADAKLVLVGDDYQLPEIQAGGAFRALAESVGAIELRSIRRQRHAWDRSSLAALRAGDFERFVREYDQHGRIVAAPTPADGRAAMVADWWDAHRRGDGALMMAHRRRDVAELNAAAREVLREAGRLGGDVLVTAHRAFAIGDRVIAGRNDSRLGVVSGQAGTLTAIAADRLVVAFDGRPPIALPRSYAASGNLDHAYAITAHRAQGATVDRAFVLGSDELYREWGYTALSRHRDDARFYVSATPDVLNRPPALVEGDQDAARAAVRMLATSRAQQLALDGVEPGLRRAIDPLAALGPRQIDPTLERPSPPELELGRAVDDDIGIGL